MKIVKVVYLIIIILSSVDVPAQIVAHNTPGKNSSNDVDWIKQVTRKYSPDSWNLLVQYENLSLKQEAQLADGSIIWAQKPVKTFHYLKGRSKTDLLFSMSTNVHEISHAFFRHNSFRYANENGIQMNWDYVQGFIYLSPSNSYFISFPRKILFPSSKLGAVIPEKMKTFRYDTYIKGNSSTQSEGVIGLLNELHAYYLGSKFTYEMLEAYKISVGDVVGFYYWVSHLQSIISAYYEFDFFIREYLLYMKARYPVNYERLKSDKSFRGAYSSVVSSFNSLIQGYGKKVNQQVKLLNESGAAELSIENDILWIWQKGSKTRKGTSFFSEDKEKIEAFLKTDRYQPIEKDFILNR